MNAGMFKQDQSPVGLYIENRPKLHDADTRGGATNFHMKPNGVFWIGDGVAGVTETSRYLANPAGRALRDPIRADAGRRRQDPSENQAERDLAQDPQRRGRMRRGAVVFAIAEEPVTFDAFARLFRDGLGCHNALFLDGSVSSLYAPELNRDDELAPIGPIVGVVRPTSADKQ